MRVFLAPVAFGGALLFATASWAATAEPTKPATLEPVKGEVWINHGKGFEKVNSSKIVAKLGDSVMVSPDGIAKVTYPDGCETNVKPGGVMTIAPLSPCASGSLAADLEVYKARSAAAPPPWPCAWPVTPICFAPLVGLLALTHHGECNTLYCE